MRIVLAGLAAASLVGCVKEQYGGAGQTSEGAPLAGHLELDHGTQMFNVSIQSPKGWTCNSEFKHSGQNLQIRTVPLTCSNGQSGNLIMTRNAIQHQLVGSFSLRNGESGRVIFGRT